MMSRDPDPLPVIDMHLWGLLSISGDKALYPEPGPLSDISVIASSEATFSPCKSLRNPSISPRILRSIL